jgi:DNA-binding IscR family transcriptional regulator
MEAVAGRFDEGQAAPLTWLVDTTELPEPTVERLVAELVAEGYLHRVDARQDAVSLARGAGVISAAELMEIGYRLSDGSQRNRRSRIVRRLREAQLALASQLTLANLTPELAGSNQDPGDR